MDDMNNGVDRLRDRVSGIERHFERLDERMVGKLGKDDATMLMEFSTAGDNKIREDVIARLNDFRVEVRGSFTHNEKETAAAIYKAVTESEARVMTAITAMNGVLTAMSAPQDRRGWHPAVTYGGGGASLATIAAVLIYLAANGRLGMG